MHRNAKHSNRGFTLAEMLIVVAILVILAGVAFIGIVQYQRTTKLLEMDGIAKEIYVAAQNHLSLADSQGLIAQRAKAGTQEGSTDVYYFVVPSYDFVTKSDSVLNLMLPMAAVDETVRLGGSYIVRYQKSTATVLDVFYSNRSTVRFGHDFGGDELATLLESYREDGRDNRLNYGGAVIGWYGGAAASALASTTLLAPSFEVVNGDQLYVEISNPNSVNSNARLTLIVRSTVSKSSSGGPNEKVFELGNPASLTKILDDVTDPANHFSKLFPDFIPGEDIEISLMVSPVDALGQPIVVGPKTTNSLFADGSANGTALISSFRHLENLDSSISGVNPGVSTGAAPLITGAKQINDLSWSGFWSDKNVYELAGLTGATKTGCYHPVTTGYSLAYDGLGHSITGVKVEDFGGNAGLFGTLNSLSGSSVSNLKLVDFRIDGTNAGALSGVAIGTTITNVLAVSSGSDVSVTGSGSVGGLVGSASSTVFDRCAASLLVSSTGGDVGGLVGTASGSGMITACYSGGRTDNGAYATAAYNVTGTANVGGLVGDAGGTTIVSSYSTCSASGATVGGLVGTASGAISGCYATGLVSGTTQEGAFAGSHSGTASNCHYYMIINERPGFSYLGAVGNADKSGVTALDADAAAYNAFIGAQNGWQAADPDDSILKTYYNNKYPLPTVSRLDSSVAATDFVAVHYGDWPAPELRAVNP